MQKLYKNCGLPGFKIRAKIFAVLFFATLLSEKAVANVYVPTTFTDPAFTAINNATGVITAGAGVGLISLRSALTAADNLGGTHTITLSTGTYNLTLALPNRQITIGNTAQNITINGNGPTNTIINMVADANKDRILFINPVGTTNNVVTNVSGIKFQNGSLTSDPFGGAGICAGGGLGNALTVNNCTFDNNSLPAGAFGGAAVCMQVSGDLTVDNCTFTNNVSNDADGGAILFIIFNNNPPGYDGDLSVTNSTFTNNSVVFPGAGTSNGGALAFTGQGGIVGTFSVTINNNTFTGNTADGLGGAISANNSPNISISQIHFNRFFNNTSAASATSSGLHFVESSGSVNAENNWWGCNTNPVNAVSTSPCNQAGGDVPGLGSLDANPWLQLKVTASPSTICNTPAGLGNTSTVTASFLNNSDGTAIPVANLSRLIGLPVTWPVPTLGSLSGQQLTIQASGTATALFTSNGTGGTATVNAQVDNLPAGEISPAQASIIVNTLPTVTNPANFTSCVGGTATFTSTITGTPAPTIQWRIGAVALVNGLQGSGSTVSGATTATLTITNVQVGDASVNYNVQATNQCGTATSANATLFVNAVTGGTVAADQTICSGGDPALFTETVASTGSGALTYQWQSSTTSCAAGFSNIGGATGTTYDAPSGLATTTFYRRVTTSTLNAVPCTANSNCITVTVNSVTGGTVAADQTICSGGDPALFTQSVASTGSGALTYQWQSSTTSCAAGFSDIGGATATTYDPPSGLLVTTFYRRVTTSTLNAVLCTANSNCITVSVNNVTGGTVAADQTICSGGDPALFTQSVASTGSGALTYQWQSSTTSCAAGFSNIGGATATTYDAPTGLLVTTFYRRVTTSTLNAVPCTANSNCITVTINNVTGGTVAADQTICSGGDPAAFTESVASTGSGALTYQWQSSTTSCAAGFSDIGGATATTYDPPSGLLVTTFYRRVTTSTLNAVACTANSNCITVTVNNVTGGTVGTDHSVCPGGDPNAFTQSVASTGSGALTYQWQSSTTSCAAGFSDIGGATAVTYDAPAGLAVTTFYRRVTTSTLNAVLCTAISNCITVTVNPTNTITLTSAPGTDAQTVLINTPITNITYATTGATGILNNGVSGANGLPAGVAATLVANVVTISGTPTVSGLFNYTITLTGGCGIVTATGSINVITCSITRTSAVGTDAQTVCINTPIINITYATVTATGATFSGLPTGVNGVWAANVVTISGTPSVAGVFPYIVTLTGGGCAGVTANGTISSNDVTGGTVGSDQTICSGGDPAAFTQSVASTGTGVLTYQWQSSTTSCAAGFSNIGGATATTYDPPAGLLATTYYRRVTTSTLNAVGCTANSNCITVTVNPIPTAIATPSSQTICSGAAITTIVITGTGTTFNWTRDNTVAVTGIAASGSGNISGSLTNTTPLPVTVTFTITPIANGCPGPAITATVLVNPIPVVIATPSSQTICSGAAITTIVLSSTTPGTTYNWTRDNTVAVTGIAASGSGNISGSLTNTTNAPVTVTFTITPTANGCPGAPITATVLVNPTPNAVATPSSQTTCSGQTITTIVLTGNVGGTVFNWTRDNTGTVTGIAASGSGNISGALTNLTVSPITVTFTITPTANGCPGTPITATVLVNPTPDATATPPSQTICSGSAITTIVITGTVPGTIFNWTRNNTGTVTGIPASGTGNISGSLTNTTFAPITVTFTITPTAFGCQPGTPVTATVLVNPTPNAVATPASQNICTGNAITTIVLSGSVAGTTFNWTRNNLVNVTGIAASGSGNISGSLTNNTAVSQTVTFTITPTANGCPGAPITATVTVNIPPTIICPANITVNNTPGQCGAIVNYPPATVTGSPPPVVTYSQNSGTFFPVGTTTVTVTATNICGTATCSFTITVLDVEPPVIICPANITRNNDPGLCSAVVTYPLPTVTDNCPTPVQFPASFAAHGGGTVFSLQGNTLPGGLFFTLTNNSAQARTVSSFGVRFGDPAFGLVTAPQTLTIWSRPGLLTAAIENSTAGWTQQGPQVVNPIPPYFPTGTGPLGICGMNSSVVIAPGASASFFIHGVTACPIFNYNFGFSPPIVNSGFTMTGGTISFDVLGSANHFNQGTVNGIINIKVNYTVIGPPVLIGGLASGSVFPVGTTTNTYRATDAAGNTATCSFTVTVVDAEQPTLTCPPSIVRNTDPGLCTATIAVANPTFSDNCGVTQLTWVMSGATIASSPATGINFVGTRTFNLNGTTGQGITTIVYTARDAAGNIRTCTFTVTVNDLVLPVITLQPATKFVCVGSNAVFTITAAANGGPLNYQWQEWNGTAWVNIAGATTNTYSIPSVTFADNTRSFRVVITGLCSVVISSAATLYVNPLPTITLIPSIPPSLLPGQFLTITANGNPPGGTFAWYFNGVLVPSRTGSSWPGITIEVGLGTYRVVYTDLNGCVATSPDLVVVGQPSRNIYVYPNPNTGQFVVRFYNQPGESVTVNVYDSKGSRVYQKEVVTGTPYTGIDVDLGSALAAGVYVVEVRDGSGRFVGAKRIVVRHP